MKTPVNARTLKQHLTYNFWKYLLIAAVAFGLVSLLYPMTEHHSPADKKVEFFVYGVMDEQGLTEYMSTVMQSEMSDMEVMAPRLLLDDGNYGPMQLVTYMAVGEGDLYLLPKDEFVSVASSGGLVPLEDDAELMDFFNGAGIQLQSGWRRNTETGETHLYGIPQSKLPGLSNYAYAKDGYLCVTEMGGNVDNTRKFLRILCRDMMSSAASEPEPSPVP